MMIQPYDPPMKNGGFPLKNGPSTSPSRRAKPAEALTICAARVAADGGDARKALQERGAEFGSRAENGG